jgi:septum formation protein
MQIILGSTSPRRAEILHFFSLPFLQVASHFAESSVAFRGDPVPYVQELSQKKGESLLRAYSDHPIVTADTIVFCEGRVYNKPQDKKEAVDFLQTLSGKWHSVFTSLSLFYQGSFETKWEETKILFHPLSFEQIDHYLQHIRFLDKAGGYAIQQGGGLIVKKIEGCYYNVMGLPLGSLQELLLRIPIDLWQHIKNL